MRPRRGSPEREYGRQENPPAGGPVLTRRRARKLANLLVVKILRHALGRRPSRALVAQHVDLGGAKDEVMLAEQLDRLLGQLERKGGGCWLPIR